MLCLECKNRDCEHERYTGIFLTCRLQSDSDESITKVIDVFQENECKDFEYGSKK